MENTIAGSSTALPKLPLWNVIKLSYSTYFANFIDVLRIVWLWMLLLIPLFSVLISLETSWISRAFTNLHVQPGVLPQALAPPIELTVASHLSNLLLAVCGVSIAVAWHRKIILGERPGISGSNIASRSFWRYILTGIIIVLISILPPLLIVFTVLLSSWLLFSSGSAALSPLLTLLFPFAFVFYFIVMAITLRLSLLLPARAVGNVELSIREALKATHWNTWRLFWGLVACSLPPILLAPAAFWLIVGLPEPESFPNPAFTARFAAFGSLTEIYYLLMLPIAIGFLSHAYQHFFGRARAV